MPEITVMQAKRFGVHTCGVDTPLLDAARRMADEDISALVAIDAEGYLAGIITRTDLVRAYRQHEGWTTRHVAEYMNPHVVTVGLQTPLSQVADLLLEKKIHRVVMVREEGDKARPVGVFSIADLLYHMVREMER